MTQTEIQRDIEKVIADELAFAEHLATLNEWDSMGELIQRYNDVDIACQCVLDEASKEDRERIRLAMVKLRDEHLALNQRACFTWAQREVEERRLQIVHVASKLVLAAHTCSIEEHNRTTCKTEKCSTTHEARCSCGWAQGAIDYIHAYCLVEGHRANPRLSVVTWTGTQLDVHVTPP